VLAGQSLGHQTGSLCQFPRSAAGQSLGLLRMTSKVGLAWCFRDRGLPWEEMRLAAH
jgi:hypothetical protein